MHAPQPHSAQPMAEMYMPMGPAHPVVLLQAIATGDEAAMATLYDATSAMVYGLALRILGDPTAAEEVTMEVYLQVWNQAAQYDAQRGTPNAWLCTITRSRALDQRRKSDRYHQREWPLEVVEHMPDTAPSPADLSVTQQEHILVHGALQRLPPEQREIIELAYFAGLSHRDIAERLGQPLGTVKTRIRLGMDHLRSHLLPRMQEDA